MAYSLAEVQGWHNGSPDKSLVDVDYLTRFFSMYDDWIRSGDHRQFLLEFNDFQLALECFEHQFIFDDETNFVLFCSRRTASGNQYGFFPEAEAFWKWKHEIAHIKAASKLGIESVVRLTSIPNGGYGHYFQPWVQLRVVDLERIANNDLLFSAIYEIIHAPAVAGYGEGREEEIASAILEEAIAREGFR